MQYEQQNSLHTTLQSHYLAFIDSLLELLLFVSREAIKEGIESMRNVAHGIGTDLPAAIDEVQDKLLSLTLTVTPFCVLPV